MESTAVDLAWLNRSLRPSLATERAITDFTATPIGTGQVGENVRYELQWDGDDAALPASVVGKFPSTSPVSRATAVQLDTYTKEIGFYRDLADRVDIAVPAIQVLEWDARTHDFALLMSDVRPATAGDQIEGGTVDQAALAIDEAAKLHAPLWGRLDELGAVDWLDTDPRARVDDMSALVELLVPGFVERFRERLGGDVVEVASLLAGSYRRWSTAVADWADAHDAWCLVHGDFRLDNMLFGRGEGARALTVVDWQTTAVGVGPADVAYYLGAGLDPALRSRHERDLMGRYGRQLRLGGVVIDDAALWEAYVLGSATGCLMAALASQIVERTERGDEMFAVMAERHVAQMVDVGLVGLLA